MQKRKVVISEPRLAHYRVPLFEIMKQQLEDEKVELTLLLGKETRDEAARHDSGHLDWAIKIPTTYFAGERFCWQPLGRYVKGADLVVVNQHNKLLYNHLMMIAPRSFRLAFWDHGRNMQSQKPIGLKERFKRWSTSRVDWWFAYTQMTKDLVAESGFPADRITVLNNSIDTSELSRFAQDLTPQEVQAVKSSLNLSGKRVGLYLGSLYPDKRLDFLVEAAQAVRNKISNFELLIIGDGLDRDKVRQWANAKSWVHWVGAKKGRDKALYSRVAEVMLMPAQVGLAILDSFVLGLPLITTNYPNHSPEVVYLVPGVNGVMTADNIAAFANGVTTTLEDEAKLELLRAGCARSAREYTVEHMAARFVEGIHQALTLKQKVVA